MQQAPEAMTLKVIAHIHTAFPTKFGIPRQSGLIPDLKAEIVFEPEYRNPDALRGIEEFSHLWLIWEFDKVAGAGWSPTVLPPTEARAVTAETAHSPFSSTTVSASQTALMSSAGSISGAAAASEEAPSNTGAVERLLRGSMEISSRAFRTAASASSQTRSATPALEAASAVASPWASARYREASFAITTKSAEQAIIALMPTQLPAITAI